MPPGIYFIIDTYRSPKENIFCPSEASQMQVPSGPYEMNCTCMKISIYPDEIKTIKCNIPLQSQEACCNSVCDLRSITLHGVAENGSSMQALRLVCRHLFHQETPCQVVSAL